MWSSRNEFERSLILERILDHWDMWSSRNFSPVGDGRTCEAGGAISVRSTSAARTASCQGAARKPQPAAKRRDRVSTAAKPLPLTDRRACGTRTGAHPSAKNAAIASPPSLRASRLSGAGEPTACRSGRGLPLWCQGGWAPCQTDRAEEPARRGNWCAPARSGWNWGASGREAAVGVVLSRRRRRLWCIVGRTVIDTSPRGRGFAVAPNTEAR